MGSLKDCLGKADSAIIDDKDRKFINDKYNGYVSKKIAPDEAARKSIMDLHEKQHNDINKLKALAKQPITEYKRPLVSENVQVEGVSESEINRIYNYKSEITKAKRLFGYFDNSTESGKKALNDVIKEFKGKIENAKQNLADLQGNDSETAKKEIKKISEFINVTQKGIDLHEPEKNTVSEDDIKVAQAEHNVAKSKLTKAENEVAKTQSQQTGLFGGEQKGMFAMGRDEAKSVLDPLRKKVKETKANLEELQKKFEVQKTANEPELFKTERGVKAEEEKRTYKAVNNIDTPTDAYGLALQYLAGGGKIGKEDFGKEVSPKRDERFSANKGAKEETSARNYLETNGKTVKEVAHSIWENLPDHLQENISDQDIRNELIDVMNTHNTRLDIAKDYVDKYGNIADGEITDANIEHFQKMYAAEIDAEQKMMERFDQEQLENDNEITESDEYINHIINQYEQENSKENNGTTESGKGQSSQTIGNTKSNQSQAETENKSINQKPKEVTNASQEPTEEKVTPEEQTKGGEQKPPLQDLGTKARDLAKQLRSGEKTILPDWLKAKLPEGTKKAGISIEDAFAKALETFADIHDATKDFAKAVEAGFKHIKDWFDKNGIDYDEADLKARFKDDLSRETGIKNAVTDRERLERGLQPIEKELGRAWDSVVLKEAKDAILSGEVNPLDLAASLVAKPRPLTDTENAILTIGRMQLHNEHKAASQQLEEAFKNNDEAKQVDLNVRLARIRDDINNNDIAAKKTGTLWGQAGNARKIMIREDYSLANQEQQFRNANNGQPIPKEVQEKLNILTSQLADATKKLTDYEGKIKDLESRKALKEVVNDINSRKGQRAATKEELKTERNDLIEQIKKIAREQSQKLSSTPFPIEMIPVLGKLAKNYIKDGIITLEGIADNIYNDLKEHIEGLTKKDVSEVVGTYMKEENAKRLEAFKKRATTKEAELKGKLASGDVLPKQRIKIAYDEEALRLRANIERLKDKIDDERFKLQQQNRTKFQKGLDWFAKWRRAVILSSVTTLGKLTSAASYRQATTFLEEIAGTILHQIPGIKSISKGAPREGGGINMKAEIKSISQWWQKATYRDIKNIITQGKGELDYLYGKKRDLPQVALDFIGNIHGALKAPAKRAEFFRSFEKRLEFAAKNGENPNDPTVQAKVAGQAYIDANRAIFMQDNILTDSYKRMIDGLEQGGEKGKIAATTMKILLPIVKIPTNYVAETTSLGFGWAKAATSFAYHALTKGLENITPEQKDYIIRNLKKGGVGAGFLALGFMNPQAIGGYYTGKRKGEDLQAGDITLFGAKLPHWLLHAPFIEVMQMGATLRRVQDEYSAKGKEGGTMAGVFEAGKGLTEEVPFIGETTGLAQGAENIGAAAGGVGRFMEGLIVPPDVNRIAQATDKDEEGNPIKRKPQGTFFQKVGQSIEMGIPGLRQNVTGTSGLPDEVVKKYSSLDWVKNKLGYDITNANLNSAQVKEKGVTERKHVNDYPDKKQAWTDAYNLGLAKNIAQVKSQGYIYVNEHNDVINKWSASMPAGYKPIKITSMTKEQKDILIPKMISKAREGVSEATTDKIFGKGDYVPPKKVKQ